MDDPTRLVVLITSVILERPTCLLCIAAKTGDTKLAVVRALERIAQSILVSADTDERCRMCGSMLGPVYSLKRRE